MTLLVTGGAGYIGTHTLVELHAAGVPHIVLDNFSNSSPAALQAVASITGAQIDFAEADVCDAASLRGVFESCRSQGRPVSGVLHLAALKAVGESTTQPLRYYRNNVDGTLNLLEVMQEYGVQRFVFSSSATVYGEPQYLPYDESHPIAPTNPYGETKAIVERLLASVAAASPGFKAITLRYFNPIGAHPSGRIGEDPRGIPNNLFPFITRVAVGTLPKLSVFGNDYPTPDGTGVRDYLHVMDLARAHVKAVQHADDIGDGFTAINLGTGRGVSVLELVSTFERINGVRVGLEIVGRRPGDVAQMWADPSLAAKVLRWQAECSVEDMCRDGWRWQESHPHGFAG